MNFVILYFHTLAVIKHEWDQLLICDNCKMAVTKTEHHDGFVRDAKLNMHNKETPSSSI